ncbi:MAG: ABC transporter permease [Nitrosomonas sp.]|nr:ABC transporter permease [Nitrosomonas sp.]MBK7363846.1 ABC transporter permease [Nitrosomonas sp.]
MTGFFTLFHKELLRFWKVSFQTILAPIVSTLLYLFIFSHLLESRVQVYPGITYSQFLIPGLIIMAILQNAFANSSSSLIQSKISGNIIFVLLSPLSYFEFFGAYLLASVARGLLVGLGVFIVISQFYEIPTQFPFWIILFVLLGSMLLGALGIIAGICSDKFDQLAAFQNFIILPFTFLSGVFYSVFSLSPVWQKLSYINPFFYIVDGFRYGFLGISDVPPHLSLTAVIAFFLTISLLTLNMLRAGYKVRY